MEIPDCGSDPRGMGTTERSNYVSDGTEWAQGCCLGMEKFPSLSELYILSSIGGLSFNVGDGCSFVNWRVCMRDRLKKG